MLTNIYIILLRKVHLQREVYAYVHSITSVEHAQTDTYANKHWYVRVIFSEGC